MLRTRLILLVTVAALLAPALAPCLLAAPVTHAQMACCPRQPDATPAAQPCCATGDDQPLAPPQDSARATQAATALAVLAGRRPLTVTRRRPAPDAPRIAQPSGLRSTVLLI